MYEIIKVNKQTPIKESKVVKDLIKDLLKGEVDIGIGKIYQTNVKVGNNKGRKTILKWDWRFNQLKLAIIKEQKKKQK